MKDEHKYFIATVVAAAAYIYTEAPAMLDGAAPSRLYPLGGAVAAVAVGLGTRYSAGLRHQLLRKLGVGAWMLVALATMLFMLLGAFTAASLPLQLACYAAAALPLLAFAAVLVLASRRPRA